MQSHGPKRKLATKTPARLPMAHSSTSGWQPENFSQYYLRQTGALPNGCISPSRHALVIRNAICYSRYSLSTSLLAHRRLPRGNSCPPRSGSNTETWCEAHVLPRFFAWSTLASHGRRVPAGQRAVGATPPSQRASHWAKRATPGHPQLLALCRLVEHLKRQCGNTWE